MRTPTPVLFAPLSFLCLGAFAATPSGFARLKPKKPPKAEKPAEPSKEPKAEPSKTETPAEKPTTKPKVEKPAAKPTTKPADNKDLDFLFSSPTPKPKAPTTSEKPEPKEPAKISSLPESPVSDWSADTPGTALLVTSPELADAWQDFRDWKAENGIPVELVTTDEIDANPDFDDAPDLQEKIRQRIRHGIDHHDVRWVILGGDSEPGGGGHVPDRDTVHRTDMADDKDIPTDIYYISPTCWDADDDGIYGEFKDDRDAIRYPDGSIGLGRIPVRTTNDVAAYTAKVIDFAAHQTASADTPYAKRLVYTCTVPHAYPKVRRSWDDHVSKVFEGAEVERHFSDTHKLTPGRWVMMLNDETSGKYHFHGHGLHDCWVLDGHKKFTQRQIARLENKGATPIITTVSCFTGHFDSDKDPCISERMLRVPNAGAIAIVAPCRTGKPHFPNPRTDMRLMVKQGKMDGTTSTMTFFWEEGIGKNLTTGEALMSAKARLSGVAEKSAALHMCLSEINLLGDPTIEIRAGAKRKN